MKLLQSKKLAVWLIIILTLASLAGVIIPQETQGKGEYDLWALNYAFLAPVVKLLGLNRVFQTKWFLILVLIFFINLTSCTLGQLNRLWRLRQTLRQDGQAVPQGYWGVLGNCIFHLGLVIIVIGSLLTFGYKMSGYVEITEGETFVESHGNYGTITEGPLFDENHLGFQVTHDKQTRYFEKDGQLDYVTSRITVRDNGKEIVYPEVERGRPFTYRGVTFYHYKSGFAPFITITDPQGQKVLEGYAVFNSLWHNNNGQYNMDLELPGTEIILKARFYPDAIVKNDRMTTRTLKLANPVIQATVMEKGKLTGKVEFKPGQNAAYNGWTMSMGDVRFWSGYEVVRDPGAGAIFAGFWICLAGLTMSFLLTPRRPRREHEDGC